MRRKTPVVVRVSGMRREHSLLLVAIIRVGARIGSAGSRVIGDHGRVAEDTLTDTLVDIGRDSGSPRQKAATGCIPAEHAFGIAHGGSQAATEEWRDGQSENDATIHGKNLVSKPRTKRRYFCYRLFALFCQKEATLYRIMTRRI